MPREGSQIGFAVVLASPDVLHGEGDVCVLEAISQRMKRQVRSSMAVEVGGISSAFEHADYARAVFSEMTNPNFNIRSWRSHITRWRQFGVVDVKTAFDTLQGDGVPEDRRVAVDVAALRADLADESNSGMRWIPGEQQITDDLTKMHGNGLLRIVLESGRWHLKEDPAVRERRRELREKRKAAVQRRMEAVPEADGAAE